MVLMAFLIETQDESSWFDWICGWCIRFDQRCMDICRGKTNNIHTFHWFMWQKYDYPSSVTIVRLPEYMWIRINSKKWKRKNKTQNGLQCETIHFCFMNFIMSIVLMWIAIPLPVANWWCDIQEETNEKKTAKKPMIETLISNFEYDCFGFQ